MPSSRRLPLLLFGVYEAPLAFSPVLRNAVSLSPPRPDWDAIAYGEGFAAVHDYIAAGDIYQANLTFSAYAALDGSAHDLAAALRARQPVRFGAVIEGGALGDCVIVSRSPELFFATDSAGRIETRPMKGTASRATDPEEDRAAAAHLALDPKNRAENLMITDLLRNDLSRIAKPGTVRVPKLFAVETLATVHQMTSTITAELTDEATLSEIFRALYPCGSITGAPKLRAMEILHTLEGRPREIYCGAIGWAAPDGRSEFSVAIRTALIEGREVRLDVGGGVVWDSTAADEYEEAQWKLAFASRLTPISA